MVPVETVEAVTETVGLTALMEPQTQGAGAVPQQAQALILGLAVQVLSYLPWL
jgi:hypothetical protein